MRPLDVGLVIACGALVCTAAPAADEVAYRHQAAIAIEQGAPFVQLPLPASAYARSQRGDLRDLRIVDARGERVPFAVLPARVPEQLKTEQLRDATLYPLPPRPAAGGVWTAPVEVRVQGDRISVVRSGKAAPVAANARPGGWLFDLGERRRDDPPLEALRVSWTSPTEFTAPYVIETSDDLRGWRPAGGGQLMALSAATGALTQPTVVLPALSGRFVRLAWSDAATAPQLSGAKVVSSQRHSRAVDPPTELVFSSSAEPASKLAAPDEAAARALHFDLGGMLPVVQLDLRMAAGTRVVPARVQGRTAADEAWRDLVSTVFYRLERTGDASRSPPVDLRATVRYLRLLPDPRAATLDAAQTQLVVQAQLASLVFAAQGQAPYQLQAGASRAPNGALPIATLVPALDDERARFGRARLGPWSEVEAVARAEENAQRIAALRPWLLWAVLIAGVAALAFMVWRLARGSATP